MAFGASSKVFANTVKNQLNGTHAFNWTGSASVALFGNSGTPDNTVTTDVLTEYNGVASQWVASVYEVSGTGYTAGGVGVTPTTITQSSATITFNSSGSPQWTGASFTAYGCLVYDSAISNIGLCFLSFGGGAQQVTSGTFTVAWNGSGIASWAC